MQHARTQKPPSSLTSTLNHLLFIFFAICGLTGLFVLQNPGYFSPWELFSLLSIGIVGLWRWSWFFYRVGRSRFFLHVVFPRVRKRADAVPVEALPHMCFLVPSYKEQPWITERVFRAIAHEAKSLPQHITVLANTSSDEENDAIRSILEAEDPEMETIRLILMTQKDGKRKAMADALRTLAQLNLPEDTVIALMDGDSELAPGTLRRCLPFFRLFPKMGALTTDEIPVVQGSYVFSEWFHLRFAQRHLQMCSDAVSKKVMCLTGRFSLFRAEAALDPSFADQLENDALHDWLWGRFKFLSGDDKSTWYWLLSRGYDMFYVPDAVVYSIETISGSVVDRAYSNMRRWYGNMLRNNGRAIALGPGKTGWFTWYSLIDQRISFWTCLITPGFLLVSLLQGNWVAAGIIISWITFSRPLMLGLVFWGRESVIKPIHFPLLLVSQWASSLVKIWTQMNLAQQSWANRGNQSINASGQGFRRLAKCSTSYTFLAIQAFCFVVFLAWLAGILNPLWDIAGLKLTRQATANQSIITSVNAIEYGVWPNDGKDDAAALSELIHRYESEEYLEIRLPIGKLDFFQPLAINRSHFSLTGQGPNRTVLSIHAGTDSGKTQLVSDLGSYPLSSNDSMVIVVAPLSEDSAHSITSDSPISASPSLMLEDVHLRGFTLRYEDVDDSDQGMGRAIAKAIVMQNVENGSLSRIQIEPEVEDALSLNQTRNIRVEHVTPL